MTSLPASLPAATRPRREIALPARRRSGRSPQARTSRTRRARRRGWCRRRAAPARAARGRPPRRAPARRLRSARANVSAWSETSFGSPSTCSTHDEQRPSRAPRSCQHVDDGRSRSGPRPRISAFCPGLPGQRAAASRGAIGTRGRRRVDRLPLRPQPARHRRVARQVETLLHRHDRRQRQLVDVPAAGDLLLAADGAVLDDDALEPGRDTGRPSAYATRIPT